MRYTNPRLLTYLLEWMTSMNLLLLDNAELAWTGISRLEKTTRSSPHHVAQHHPTGSETTPPYAHRSSRFGSEPPSVEDDVDVWRYAILELHARNDDDDAASRLELVLLEVVFSIVGIIQTLLLLVCSSFQNIPIKFCTVIAKLFNIFPANFI